MSEGTPDEGTPADNNVLSEEEEEEVGVEVDSADRVASADENSQDADDNGDESNMGADYVDSVGDSAQGTPLIEGTDYVEYTGEGSHETPKEPPPPVERGFHRTKAQVDATLWMADLSETWDEDFIKAAFAHFDYKVLSVKIVNDKTKPKKYAFIEFESADIARKVLLKINGRTVPNDPDKRKLTLSYANTPGTLTMEYCLSVSNLSSSVTDADLFKLFAKKYISCRSAKIHFHTNGQSKGFGIVRFHSQTEQQLALVEFNKHNFRGREVYIKLAPTKTRGPKNMMNTMNQMGGMYGPPGFMPNVMGNQFQQYPAHVGMRDLGIRSSRDDRRGGRRSRSRERGERRRNDRSGRRSRSTSKERKRRYWKLDEFVREQNSNKPLEDLTVPSHWIQDDKPWPVHEYNEQYIVDGEKCMADLNSGKFSDFYIHPNWKLEDVVKQLYPETLVPDVEEC